MADHLRAAVSRNKRRYKCDGYNLDLSYIEPTIIAMGYPAEKFESMYRNQLDQVAKFLNERHRDRYKIYNLCKERQRNNYHKDKFTGNVCEDFAFEDHAPPPLEKIEPFCLDVQDWLSKDPAHVVAVHCKAGKGRTGVMICCYLLHCGRFRTAEEALQHYGKVRTVDEKGVTIPSQRRYVEYYAKMKNDSLQYEKTRLLLKGIYFENIPFNTINGSAVFTVYYGNKRKKHVNMGDLRNKGSQWTYIASEPIEVAGDVHIEFYLSKIIPGVKEKICGVCFNTFFVDRSTTLTDLKHTISQPQQQQDPGATLPAADGNGAILGGVEGGGGSETLVSLQEICSRDPGRYRALILNKSQLDRACKAKEFPDKASIQLYFDTSLPPAASGNGNAEQRHSEGGGGGSPGDDESSDDDDDDETSCVRM